jgi:hypothetical protein
MHTKDLAKALRAFAAIADFERSQELDRLATFIDRGTNETIIARVKRMSPSSAYPARLKDTLESIAVGLRATGAAKPSAAIYELLGIFGGRPGASVEDFCSAICHPSTVVSASARRFKSANPAIANDLFSELAPLLNDPEGIRALLATLSTSPVAGTATWTLVANRIIGNRRTYRDRKSAVAAISKYVEARFLIAPPTEGVELSSLR